MLNNKSWANGYWNFFHIFACNLNTEKINKKNLKLIHLFINNLIMSIPCEKCKIDTVQYFENKSFSKLSKKNEFITFFYLFHNYVNFKTKKKGAAAKILIIYNNKSIKDTLYVIDREIYNLKLNKNIYNFFLMITN